MTTAAIDGTMGVTRGAVAVMMTVLARGPLVRGVMGSGLTVGGTMGAISAVTTVMGSARVASALAVSALAVSARGMTAGGLTIGGMTGAISAVVTAMVWARAALARGASRGVTANGAMATRVAPMGMIPACSTSSVPGSFAWDCSAWIRSASVAPCSVALCSVDSAAGSRKPVRDAELGGLFAQLGMLRGVARCRESVVISWHRYRDRHGRVRAPTEP
ncbi:hypothetical protein AOB60_23880 [Streptomyces noursei]|uniref:Uncharacterized protein n=1 Tax=Streptomyces noursei TaxID=1971 RepID=A0A2N8P8L5_STRNR|nr:hypothetical protein AOB60_23880 [Streptomyces noursei]